MKRAMTEMRSLVVAGWKIPAVTLAIVVALSQVADGLAYQLAHGHGIEANPGAATFITAYGPMAMLALQARGGAHPRGGLVRPPATRSRLPADVVAGPGRVHRLPERAPGPRLGASPPWAALPVPSDRRGIIRPSAWAEPSTAARRTPGLRSAHRLDRCAFDGQPSRVPREERGEARQRHADRAGPARRCSRRCARRGSRAATAQVIGGAGRRPARPCPTPRPHRRSQEC